jgi:hypothetical protein
MIVYATTRRLQDYIGETGELALSAVIAGVDTAVNEDGGILAKRERTEQVRTGACCVRSAVVLRTAPGALAACQVPI